MSHCPIRSPHLATLSDDLRVIKCTLELEELPKKVHMATTPNSFKPDDR